MIKMLEESILPIDKIRYLASARSAGKVLQFKGQDVTIEETTEEAFEGVDIALFSAGGSTSAKYAPYAVKAGAVVVDNTSYFRQNPDVPLVCLLYTSTDIKTGWAHKTIDGGLSCQYEHQFVITKDGPVILTSQGEEGTY